MEQYKQSKIRGLSKIDENKQLSDEEGSYGEAQNSTKEPDCGMNEGCHEHVDTSIPRIGDTHKKKKWCLLERVMEGGGLQYNPRTVEEVFRDFKSRRAGILKALTTDVAEFYHQCDPEKENLCLYGFPNERWEVNLPAEEVPPELPEPALGINFARDGMQEKDWLSLVAVHSDAWLLAVAFYFGARFGFDRADRKKLFNMINDLPSIYEVVTGACKKQSKEKSAVSNNSSSKSKSNPKQVMESQGKFSKGLQQKDEDEAEDEEGLEEEDEEHGDALCGACGENYGQDQFWICCDICEKWFHGKCVKITPARAEHIKQYKCPACSNKRARV